MSERRGEQFGLWSAVTSTDGSLPASTSDVIFSVTGKVKILSIRGEVTSDIQDQACTLKIQATDGTDDTNICDPTSIRNNGDGTLWALRSTTIIPGFAVNRMATSTVAGWGADTPFIMDAGDIEIVTSATNTGKVQWEVEYKPLEVGARVTSQL